MQIRVMQRIDAFCRMFSKCLIFSACTLTIIIGSCNKALDDIDPSKAQLNIYVYALLTGNPKDNATVSVHLSESDADSDVNAVGDKRFTDNEGNVTFRNLEPGQRYWIRVKVLIDKSVNQTDELVIGENYHEVTTL